MVVRSLPTLAWGTDSLVVLSWVTWHQTSKTLRINMQVGTDVPTTEAVLTEAYHRLTNSNVCLVYDSPA